MTLPSGTIQNSCVDTVVCALRQAQGYLLLTRIHVVDQLRYSIAAIYGAGEVNIFFKTLPD